METPVPLWTHQSCKLWRNPSTQHPAPGTLTCSAACSSASGRALAGGGTRARPPRVCQCLRRPDACCCRRHRSPPALQHRRRGRKGGSKQTSPRRVKRSRSGHQDTKTPRENDRQQLHPTQHTAIATREAQDTRYAAQTAEKHKAQYKHKHSRDEVSSDLSLSALRPGGTPPRPMPIESIVPTPAPAESGDVGDPFVAFFTGETCLGR